MKPLLFCSLAMLISVPSMADVMRDPTKPAHLGTLGAAKGPQANEWVLESVVYKNGQFKAVISGSLYSKGQMLGEYLITHVDKHSVLLNQGNKQIKLELYGDENEH
ncbi:agglutinin biogenesis protein MshK [Pseudoalteromonas sp. SSDWG2]|uniref:agglutinin biogenesis protein MshK n=1 Tax=Pseudoalteromonas sp. SSDWG2 TaxID=3139391 RepID=UPI003BA98582